MMDNVCVMFGLSNAPDSIYEKMLKTAEKYYLEYGVRYFSISSYGNFDKMALKVVRTLREKYPDIGAGISLTCYPSTEEYPREFPFLERPDRTIQAARTFICYVKRPYNTRRILKYMQHIYDYDQRIITNLGSRS